MCIDDSDCNHHGTCNNNGTCDCAPSFFGDNCVPIVQYLGLPYLIIFYIIAAIYVILLFVALWKVYKFYRAYLVRRQLGIRHLTLTILTLGIMARTTHYLVVADQNWSRYNLTLYYFIYPCILVSFTCELLLWFELYTNTTNQNIEHLPKYRTVLLVLNIFIFPVELCVRITSDVLQSGPVVVALYIFWLIYMMVFLCIELGGFLFIGFKILEKVKNMTSLTGKDSQKIAFVKITRIMISNTIIDIAAVAVLIGYVISRDAWVWFALNIITNLITFASVSLMLYLAKVPSTTVINSGKEDEIGESKSTYKTVSLQFYPSNNGAIVTDRDSTDA